METIEQFSCSEKEPCESCQRLANDLVNRDLGMYETLYGLPRPSSKKQYQPKNNRSQDRLRYERAIRVAIRASHEVTPPF